VPPTSGTRASSLPPGRTARLVGDRPRRPRNRAAPVPWPWARTS
jgi:hypothetical protein